MPCATCGSATVAGAAFCGNCGTAVGAAPSTGHPAAVAPEAQAAPVPPSPPGKAAQREADRDLTRYLCAATYLDREYAHLLVRQVSAEPRLAVAAAPACDIPTVLRHAYAANARRHGRDLFLALLFLLVIALWMGAGITPVVLILLFLSWVTVVVFELSTRYGRHLQALRPESFDPADAPEPPNEDVGRRIREVGEYAGGNVSVYSGYSPFVGYGSELDSWSFTLDVTKPGKLDDETEEFDVTDLYGHVADRVRALALPALRVEERLFVDGSDILGEPRFLPDPLGRPVVDASREQLDALKRRPEDRARPYLAVHSTGWGGELVVSLFVRFARSESSLLVEAVHTVLCPLQDRYRVIDTLMPSPTVGDLAKLLGRSSVETVAMLLASPWRAVRGFALDFGMRKRLRRQAKVITRVARFDYGARISVRQQASDTKYHRYFQKLDTSMVLKVAERRVLDALVEFVAERGIDVGDLIQRQETIINNGIIATGGAKVESSTVASGKRARISVSIPLKFPFPKVD